MVLVKWVLRLGSGPKLGAPRDPSEHELEWAAQGLDRPALRRIR